MGEAVVETTLNLEEILGGFEEVDVSLVESLVGLLSVSGRVTNPSGRSPDCCWASTKERVDHLSAHHCRILCSVLFRARVRMKERRKLVLV